MEITKDIKTAKSTQEIANLGFDTEFNLPVNENLVYNPTASSIERMVQPSTSTQATELASIVASNDKTHLLLQQIRDAIAMRPDYVEATNTQAISGTIAIAGMTGTNTITTVTTLVGQTNIGGFSADMMTENNSFQDWGLSIRSLLI